MFEGTRKLHALRGRGQKFKKVTIGPDNLEVELGLITSADEMEVNAYADDHEGISKAIAVKIGILSHAIQMIAGEDLHNKKFIETGDFDDKTQLARKKQKHVFLREILETWTPAEVDELFQHYIKMVPTNAADSITLVKILTSTMLGALAEEGAIPQNVADKLENAVQEAEKAYQQGKDDVTVVEKTNELAEQLHEATSAVNQAIGDASTDTQPAPSRQRAGFVPAGTYGVGGSSAGSGETTT